MNNSNSSSEGQIKRSFMIIMALIALLICIITGVNYAIIIKEEKTIAAVDLSLKQEMFSQRIAFLSEIIVHSLHDHGVKPHKGIEQKIKALDFAITEMQKGHDILISGSESHKISKPFTELQSLYFDDRRNLDKRVNNFIKNARYISTLAQIPLSASQKKELLQTYNRIKNAAENDLLEDLDKVAKIYEKEGFQAIETLKIIEPILLIISFLTLAALWFYAFNPLYKKLASTLKSISLLQEESKREKQRLDMATKGSSTGMWDWDIRAGVFYWSLSLQSLLGLKEEQGKIYDTDFFQTLLFDESRDGFNEAVKNHLKNKEPFYYEGKVIHRTKKIIWVSFRGQALWDEDGRAYRMLGSIEDITDKRQAEKERNIYIQGVENSGLPFAIMETESDKHNFIYVAKAFCDLTGYDKQKLVESNLNIFTGPETSMGDLDTIDSAIEQNIGIKTKILGYRIDGSSFWNEITMEPIFVEGAKKASYYAVIFNDLTESLLREEKEINRQRNESLGALAASVAHEINNLLMPMTMAKDVLESELKEDCDPFAIEQLETIDEYALQAKEIVTGVLTFSRKETGKLEHANIYDLLNRSVAFIGNLLSTKTKITIEEPENDDIKNESSMVNLTEFRQIITNLAKNSEHAFDGKSGQITISLSKQNLSNQKRSELNLRATEFIIIHFTDNGQGIPKDIVGKIFDPLFTTKDVGHGTGLGLSVVHGIIRSWGGTIQVESTEGVGTKFDIYIPVAHTHDDFEYLADLLDEDSTGQ